MNVDPAAEAEAESFGLLARKVNRHRASNPYFLHLQQQSPITQALVDAWWRGWDRTDAILKANPQICSLLQAKVSMGMELGQ